MSILSRYIIRTVLGYSGLVMMILLVLSALYLFISQQDDIGVGSYGAGDALVYTLLNLPRYAAEMLPFGTLIGGLLGLGNLARASELVVMRTSGASVWRISVWVAGAGIGLALATWALGDFVAPELARLGAQQKAMAKFNEVNVPGDINWAKEGDAFISLQRQTEAEYGGMYVFELNAAHALQRIAHADGARPIDGERWRLRNYQESRFEDGRVIAARKPQAEFATTLSGDFLHSAMTEPDALSSSALLSYSRHLRENEIDTRVYDTEFWARIARAVSLVIVAVLGVPFALGPLRSTGAGARTVVGILIGAAFFLLANVLENGSQVFNLSPLIVAWTPTALLALFTSVALARVR